MSLLISASLVAVAASAQASPPVQTPPPIQRRYAPAPPPPPPPPNIGRARPARMIAGSVSEDDYPATAAAAGAEGTATVRFLIDPSGRVTSCEIVISAGHPDLDLVSCAIVTERFRFEPARDRQGRRTEEYRHQRLVWRLVDPEPEPEAPTG